MSGRSEPRVASWAVTAGLALLGVPVAVLAQLAPAPVAGVAGVALAGALAWRVFREPEHGVYALFALMPLVDLGVVWPGSGVRLTYVVVPAAIAGWVRARYRGSEGHPALHPLAWALLAPAAAGAATAPFALDPPRALLYSARLLALWVAAAFVCTQVRDDERTRRAFAVLLAVGVALTAVAVVQTVLPGAGIGRVYTPVGGDVLGRMRPAAFFMDPNFLGGLLSACALAGAALAAAASSRREALAWGVGAAACGLGMALTFSRSAWVGLAAGALLALVLAPRARRAALAGAVAAFALAAVLVAPGIVTRFTAGADGSATGRLELMRGELAIALEHPVVGVGLGSLGRAYVIAGGASRTGRVSEPHQVPLAVFGQTGVVGLGAMALVLVALARAAAERRRRGWTAADSAVAVMLAAFLVQSLFQHYAYFEPLWLALALAAAAPVRDDAPAPSGTGRTAEELA